MNKCNKRILVILTQAGDRLFEEGLQLALVLASFEHSVRLCLCVDTFKYLLMANTNTQVDNKAVKLLSALDFYDIPPPWVLCEKTHSLGEHVPFCLVDHICTNDFDHVLRF